MRRFKMSELATTAIWFTGIATGIAAAFYAWARLLLRACDKMNGGKL